MESLKTLRTEDTLKRSHEDQQREAIPQPQWDAPAPGSYNVFAFFNLEAAWEEGHTILGVGPVGGPIETYSYYRHSTQMRAPGIMACLKDPMTFQQIIDASGWITHGQPGNWWNEHLNAALALWCSTEQAKDVHGHAEAKKADTGTYDLVTYNCLTFVEECLACGGITFETKTGRRPHTFIPKDAFREIEGAKGAHRFESWKYWFPVTEPPKNGLRSISDIPGKDRPLE